jgi:hypothetical protein
MFSEVLLPIDDRWLYCINRHLGVVSSQRVDAIFDTRTGTFAHCAELDEADLASHGSPARFGP